MKKNVLTGLILVVAFISLSNFTQAQKQVNPENLTEETFKKKVFDYEKNKEKWVFEGELPCVIDFYADWCKPCKLVAPIMEELAIEYEGKVNIYKVNTEKQKELASLFQIRSIPTVLFCPMKGKPQMTQGALPKETFKQVIDEFLLGIKKEENK
ncbi:MAG: thioredoxin [Bacteroidales bacterium]|nr:thioredoxin [Bacteroidales bacterium]